MGFPGLSIAIKHWILSRMPVGAIADGPASEALERLAEQKQLEVIKYRSRSIAISCH
jgi:hypothetical protein